MLQRRYGYYWTRIIGLTAALAGLVFAMIWIGNTWWQLAVASILALILAQIAFLGHDAAHRQIFKSGRWNDWTSMVLVNLLVGMSHGWWQRKHTKHHLSPNKIGTDPDIELPIFAVTADQSAQQRRSPMTRWVRGHQALVFFPLLFLEGLSLHASSIRRLSSPGKVKHRWAELGQISVRLIGYLVLVFWIFTPGLAFAFLGVQLGIFGFYMGMAFAPNHLGMPIVDSKTRLDFFRRQVMMSRNIKGPPMLDTVMGGLNFQIEHHLFPSMPRPNLRRIAPLVEACCRQHNIVYTRTGLTESYARVAQYINRVGLNNRDVFTCPLVQNRQTPGFPTAQ